MFKSLMVSILFFVMASAILPRLCALESFAANGNRSAESPYAGQYSGDWTATPVGLGFFKDGESEHEGTWDISIASDGDVTGTEFDKTSGNKASIKGFIEDDGQINVTVKYSSTTTIKGVLEQKGVRLIGTLKQYCGSTTPCARIQITLKRKQ